MVRSQVSPSGQRITKASRNTKSTSGCDHSPTEAHVTFLWLTTLKRPDFLFPSFKQHHATIIQRCISQPLTQNHKSSMWEPTIPQGKCWHSVPYSMSSGTQHRHHSWSSRGSIGSRSLKRGPRVARNGSVSLAVKGRMGVGGVGGVGFEDIQSGLRPPAQ